MRLLKEPLLHFVLLGAALFAAYAWATRETSSTSPSRRVRLSEGDVRWLKETWTLQWQREPTPVELRALVSEYLKEELLSREAREMGLDRDDTYVRRRLAQKVEFLVADTSRLAEPTDAQLKAVYDAHPERYGGEPLATFTQVYFAREHRVDAVATLERLRAGASPMEQGDLLLVEADFREASPRSVAAQFGPKFADAVFALEAGVWHGPIESGFGFHLVRVAEKVSAKTREFAAVRAEVAERWRDDRQKEDAETFFAALLDKYDLVVDESVKPLVDGLGKPRLSK